MSLLLSFLYCWNIELFLILLFQCFWILVLLLHYNWILYVSQLFVQLSEADVIVIMKIDHNFSLSSHNLYQFLGLFLLPLRTFLNPLLKIRHNFCLENLLPVFYLLLVHIGILFNQILADLSINLLVLTFLSYL